MTQALRRYNVLFDSVRSRRRRADVPAGLDAAATALAVATQRLRLTRGQLARRAHAIVALAPRFHAMSEAALDAEIADLREAFVSRRRDPPVDHALAVLREVARRETGEEPFPVQIMGALALYHGRIIEMATGEGKTLTGSLVAPLLAWRHRHVHVFTVNDYLARRDAESRAPMYRRCRLTVGAIQQEQSPAERADLYARAIVYGTPKQITADWLRDQLRLGEARTAWMGRWSSLGGDGAWSGPLIPGLRAAVVDEADAVLIDEGVVPLIIARARRGDELAEVYRTAAAIAAELDEGSDYTIDPVHRRAELRRRGIERCQRAFERVSEPVFRARRRALELVRQALVARHCYRRGHHYQIVDGRVVIVDEYTGRFLPDRNWEHGLHQAVEAKEGVEITADRETLARMSFQRFFRSYPFLCGMTGTAADARGEMERVYGRPVVVIPTHRPVIRQHWPARLFASARAKWAAIVQAVETLHAAGRPVLIGTRSIEASEFLSRQLAARGLAHRVLNAHFDREEAELIARAGRGGPDPAITVATNMAGRGTDIKPDASALARGGLHVILSEMHAARRIDRQFIGRAGRQGDPGSAQIFLSLEDELVRLYAPRLVRGLQAWVGPEGELAGLRARVARALFSLAQRRAERRARLSRAAVLRQDDWIEKYLPGL